MSFYRDSHYFSKTAGSLHIDSYVDKCIHYGLSMLYLGKTPEVQGSEGSFPRTSLKVHSVQGVPSTLGGKFNAIGMILIGHPVYIIGK